MPQAYSDVTKGGVSAFAAGVGGAGTAILDFGTAGAFDAAIAVTGQAAILATSIVLVSLAAVPTVDHSADEHLIEDLEVRASAPTAGTGFTIRGRAGDFPLRGRWAVSWMWV